MSKEQLMRKVIDLENQVLVYTSENRTLSKEREELRKKVQELEDIIYQDERQAVLEGLYEENKRYREAMENIRFIQEHRRTRVDEEVWGIANKALEESE